VLSTVRPGFPGRSAIGARGWPVSTVKRTLQIAAVDVAVGGTWSFVNEQHLLR
jgi:hypothetical protein